MEECLTEGCDSTYGPDDLEVQYKGERIGFVCSVCIGTSPAVKLFVSKKDGDMKLKEAVFLDKPLD